LSYALRFYTWKWESLWVPCVRGPTEILKLAMTGEEDVEKFVIEHVINVRERLSEMRDIVGKNL
jgi:hypothetical protein